MEGRLLRETSMVLESQPLVSADDLEGIAQPEDVAEARNEAQVVDKKKQALFSCSLKCRLVTHPVTVYSNISIYINISHILVSQSFVRTRCQ